MVNCTSKASHDTYVTSFRMRFTCLGGLGTFRHSSTLYMSVARPGSSRNCAASGTAVASTATSQIARGGWACHCPQMSRMATLTPEGSPRYGDARCNPIRSHRPERLKKACASLRKLSSGPGSGTPCLSAFTITSALRSFCQAAPLCSVARMQAPGSPTRPTRIATTSAGNSKVMAQLIETAAPQVQPLETTNFRPVLRDKWLQAKNTISSFQFCSCSPKLRPAGAAS